MKPVNGLLTWEKAYGVRMAYNRMIGLVPVPGVVMARLFQAERDPWTGGLRRKGSVEAVKWNPTTRVILGVDESKLTYPTNKLTEPLLGISLARQRMNSIV